MAAAKKYRKRRKWSDEQQRQIVEEVRQARRDMTGTLASVAEKYDLSGSVLSRWMKRFPATNRATNGAAKPAEGTSDVQTLAAQLGEALARVKALKKALREALGD